MSFNWSNFYNDFVLALHVATGITEVAATVATGGAAGTVAAAGNAVAMASMVNAAVQQSVPTLTAHAQVNPQVQAAIDSLPALAATIVAAKNAPAA